MTSNYPNLNGRVAVVTGASSGFGASTAELLANNGARVALLARRADRIDALAKKIADAGGTALPISVDVTDADAVDAAAEQVSGQLGRVDLLVNNAGVMLAAPIDDGRSDDWARMIDTNVNGVLHVVRAFTAHLLAAADSGKPADLVNVSSIGAHVIVPTFAVYMATKAAVTHLSAGLRSEFGPRGVRVTNIEPGLGATELGNSLAPDMRDMVRQMFEQYGVLSAAEVADLIGYVTSRARHVNLRQVVILPTAQV